MKAALLLGLTVCLLGYGGTAAAQQPKDIGVGARTAPAEAGLYADSWAVLIGINEFASEKVSSLNYAVNDVQAVQAILLDLGFPPDHIFTRTNQQATRREIERLLNSTLYKRTGPHDRVLIFFSTHGVTIPLDGNREEGFLIPYDGDPDDLPFTAFSMQQLKAIGKRLKAKHVLIAIDACFSGYALVKAQAPALVDRRYWELVTRSKAIQVMTAGRQHEPVLEEGGYGVFTAEFVQGLRGFADGNRDGLITFAELGAWMHPRVAQASDYQQDMQFGSLDGEGQFVFRLATTKTPSDIPVYLETERQRLAEERARFEAEQEVFRKQTEERAKLEAERQKMEAEPLQRGEQTGVMTPEARFWSHKYQRLRSWIDRNGSNPYYRHRVPEAEKAMWKAYQKLVDLTKQGEAFVKQDQDPMLAKEPKRFEEARVRPYEAPHRLAKKVTGQDGTPMVLIPEGEFLMGSDVAESKDYEQPVHWAYLDTFYVDQYVVTTGRYATFLRATGRQEPSYWNLVSLVSEGDRPVVGVTWHDAKAYCRHYGKRLPTEAEWEKAARGTDGRTYPWGNTKPNAQLANFSQPLFSWETDLYSTRLRPVGSYDAGKSPYGVYDMAGNSWEWVSDWYNKSYYQSSPRDNPKGPAKGVNKVIRGGSWFDSAWDLRSSVRTWGAPSDRSYGIGFRCA